eukprot:1363418-Rhodomonas_salina.4
MSGTDVAYGIQVKGLKRNMEEEKARWVLLCDVRYFHRPFCSAMSGTSIGPFAMRCPVRAQPLPFSLCDARCYPRLYATCYAYGLSGTQIACAYAATDSVRAVRY